jgi:hypothetical protein
MVGRHPGAANVNNVDGKSRTERDACWQEVTAVRTLNRARTREVAGWGPGLKHARFVAFSA